MSVSEVTNNLEIGASVRRRPKVRTIVKKYGRKLCSERTLKKRLPIITWLPTYNFTILIQDIIAGITVGLTAIPQGIAYAVVAGLSPEYGLYSGLMGGFVYVFVGSCKSITIGPTAIVSTIVAKYVSDYNSDFAVLTCFLAGVVELTMGILNLGFLVEFISSPVISGFTTAAALQIAAGQLKSLFGLQGAPGNNFRESVDNFVRNIMTARLWDPILGFTTIFILMLLKRLGEGCGRTDPLLKQLRWISSLGRNAIVVVLGIIVAFIVKVSLNSEPLVLIGEIGKGLPKFSPPPFTTNINNETYSFSDMLRLLGPQSIIIPLVAILESVAIAKAFSEGVQVNATQEMIALGLCNIFGSFVRSMPITGSFTRTAINYASGVQTQAGGIFTGMLIMLALTLLTSTFYYIPKTSLAALIIAAMFSMIDYAIFKRLWTNSKRELFVFVATMFVCLYMGLEYGIVSGIIIDAAMLLFIASRPSVDVSTVNSEKGDIIVVILIDKLSYCAADHVRRVLLKASCKATPDSIIVINGTDLKSMDTTVAINLVSVIKDIEKNSCPVKILNFSSALRKMCVDINANLINNFVMAPNILDAAEIFQKTV